MFCGKSEKGLRHGFGGAKKEGLSFRRSPLKGGSCLMAATITSTSDILPLGRTRRSTAPGSESLSARSRSSCARWLMLWPSSFRGVSCCECSSRSRNTAKLQASWSGHHQRHKCNPRRPLSTLCFRSESQTPCGLWRLESPSSSTAGRRLHFAITGPGFDLLLRFAPPYSRSGLASR